jgi:hypothetical protein
LVKNVEVDIKTRGARVRIWSNQWHRNGNVSNNGDNNKFPFLFFFCLQIFFFFFVIVHFVLSYLFSDSFSISLQQVSYFTFFFHYYKFTLAHHERKLRLYIYKHDFFFLLNEMKEDYKTFIMMMRFVVVYFWLYKNIKKKKIKKNSKYKRIHMKKAQKIVQLVVNDQNSKWKKLKD